jgi:hypothetical protein
LYSYGNSGLFFCVNSQLELLAAADEV